jgi:hypothetical protein
MAICDATTLQALFTIQSPHPYAFTGAHIVHRRVHVANATEFILRFSPLSAYAAWDRVRITVETEAGNVTLLDALGMAPLLGLQLPQLRVPGDSFLLEVSI